MRACMEQHKEQMAAKDNFRLQIVPIKNIEIIN